MSEISEMSIYAKIGKIQVELLEMPIKKSGKNKFSGFEYHELEDLLPPIILLLNKYNMMHYFNFPFNIESMTQKAELVLKNLDNINEELVFEVPFPELESLNKGMNLMQSEGSYITYLKRYLLINAFGIVEKEIIDATSNNNDNPSTGESKIRIEEKPQTPSALNKVIERCKEDFPDTECDKKLLNKVSMKMFREKIISKKEREEIYEYLFPKKQ